MIRNNQKGLTLVEAIIAIAVFAIFALLVNSIFFNILRGATKQRAIKEVKQSGDFALTLMSNRIRYGTTILDPAQCNGSNDFIEIQNSDGSITRYDIDDNRIRSTTTSSDTPPDVREDFITSNLVELSPAGLLVFNCDNTSQNPLISIEFDLQHINNIASPDRPEEQARMHFRTQVYMR
jgi:prepilin-type N-terminal cleavage/methylation domain-containing protein